MSQSQSTCKPHLYGVNSWSQPTTKAVVGEFIDGKPFVRPTTEIIERREYPNANVLLITTRDLVRRPKRPDVAYLLNADDQLIATPNFHYGDRVTDEGEYICFDCPMPETAGVVFYCAEPIDELGEIIGLTTPYYAVTIDGQDIGEGAIDTGNGYEYRGMTYRSLNQVAHLATRIWHKRQAETTDYM
jgi:hypothetical protein